MLLGPRLLALVSRGLPFALLCYALLSHAMLQAGLGLPRVLMPLCALAGLTAAWLGAAGKPALGGGDTQPGESQPGDTQPGDTQPGDTQPGMPAWAIWGTVLLLGAGLGFVCYASVVTPDRSWDGLVFWTLRAQYLQPPVDLGQAFFNDADAFSHSPQYPLLHSLVLGAALDLAGPLAGRLWFPLLFAALLLSGLAVARTQRWSTASTLLLLLGLGLSPIFYSRAAGSVSSGYADLMHCWLLTLAGIGLLRGDGRLLFCVGLLLPLSKPEGLLHLLGLCLVAACRSRAAGSAGLFWGGGLGLLLWFPLQAKLLRSEVAIFDYGAGVMLPLVMLALQGFCRWWQPRPRTLVLAALVLPLCCLGLAAAFHAELAQSRDPLFSQFAARAAQLGERLGDLPNFARLSLQGFADLNKFGLAFLLLLLCGLLPKDSLPRLPTSLLVFLLGNLALALMAMLLSPDPDLDHEFRSRFDRLLLQQLGLVWLLLAAGPLQVLTRGR